LIILLSFALFASNYTTAQPDNKTTKKETYETFTSKLHSCYNISAKIGDEFLKIISSFTIGLIVHEIIRDYADSAAAYIEPTLFLSLVLPTAKYSYKLQTLLDSIIDRIIMSIRQP